MYFFRVFNVIFVINHANCSRSKYLWEKKFSSKEFVSHHTPT